MQHSSSMIFNLQFSHGLTLCLSGFSTIHPLTLSNEIADHDKRREAMKKQKFQEGRLEVASHEGDQEMGIIEGTHERLFLEEEEEEEEAEEEEEEEEEIEEIRNILLGLIFDGDLVKNCFSCTAKAA